MKRFAFYIAIFFLIFIFSTAITFIWNDQHWEFAMGSFGTCGDFEKGFKGGGGFVSYVFYDGTKLAFSRAGFDSAEDAKSCFESELAKAVEIVERETLFDKSHEKVVGERAVVIFPPNEYAKDGWAEIMVLDGDRIIGITSPSLRHALNFEKSKRVH